MPSGLVLILGPANLGGPRISDDLRSRSLSQQHPGLDVSFRLTTYPYVIWHGTSLCQNLVGKTRTRMDRNGREEALFAIPGIVLTPLR